MLVSKTQVCYLGTDLHAQAKKLKLEFTEVLKLTGEDRRRDTYAQAWCAVLSCGYRGLGSCPRSRNDNWYLRQRRLRGSCGVSPLGDPVGLASKLP
jgi:hypothetical protein